MKCPDCKGECTYRTVVIHAGFGGGETCICDLCNGTGKISLLLWIRYKFTIWRYK